MLNSDTPAKTVESAYFEAECALDIVGNQLGTVASLARLTANAEELDEGVADSFRAIADLIAFNCAEIDRQCAEIERKRKMLAPDNVVGITAGK